MKLLKRILLGVGASLLITGAAAPTMAQDAAKEHYALVTFLRGSGYFNFAYAGFKDAAATVGATAELQGPADWDASAESRAIDQLVAKGVKGIAVAAGDGDTLISSINAAVNAKIPVVTFDSDSPKSKRLLFVGTDNYKASFDVGVQIGKKYGDKARVGISLFPGNDAINQRIAGFKAGLASVAKGGQVVEEVNDEGDLQKAEVVITAMLQSHPEINTIFLAHGNPSTGAYNATRNVGRDQGDDHISIISWSLETAILQGLDDNEFAAIVAQNPYMMGVQSFFQLYAAAHPTQFDSWNHPGFGNIPKTLNVDVKILTPGDPAIQALMTPPKL